MKRDKDFLRTILLEMQESEIGFILHELVLSPSEHEKKLDHHLDLLIDEGLVSRKGKHGFRLTAVGHDAVEAIGKSATWDKIKSLSPGEAYEVVKGLTSSTAALALAKLLGLG